MKEGKGIDGVKGGDVMVKKGKNRWKVGIFKNFLGGVHSVVSQSVYHTEVIYIRETAFTHSSTLLPISQSSYSSVSAANESVRYGWTTKSGSH